MPVNQFADDMDPKKLSDALAIYHNWQVYELEPRGDRTLLDSITQNLDVNEVLAELYAREANVVALQARAAQQGRDVLISPADSAYERKLLLQFNALRQQCQVLRLQASLYPPETRTHQAFVIRYAKHVDAVQRIFLRLVDWNYRNIGNLRGIEMLLGRRMLQGYILNYEPGNPNEVSDDQEIKAFEKGIRKLKKRITENWETGEYFKDVSRAFGEPAGGLTISYPHTDIITFNKLYKPFLSPEEAKVIDLLCGISGKRVLSDAEVASELGISEKVVRLRRITAERAIRLDARHRQC